MRQRGGPTGEIATDVYRARYSGLRGLLRDRDLALLGRIVAAGDAALNGELLSALFFASELLRRLIELGKTDAQAWLSEEHEEGLWQVGPLPDQARRPASAEAPLGAQHTSRQIEAGSRTEVSR